MKIPKRILKLSDKRKQTFFCSDMPLMSERMIAILSNSKLRKKFIKELRNQRKKGYL